LIVLILNDYSFYSLIDWNEIVKRNQETWMLFLVGIPCILENEMVTPVEVLATGVIGFQKF
jgi:hypothetical protein